MVSNIAVENEVMIYAKDYGEFNRTIRRSC
mgnify:CR=1 FL=1